MCGNQLVHMKDDGFSPDLPNIVGVVGPGVDVISWIVEPNDPLVTIASFDKSEASTFSYADIFSSADI